MFTFNCKKLLAVVAGAVPFISATIMSSCITNDLPYPHIQPNFVTFEIRDQERAANIDSASATVTVFLPETVNIQAVDVDSYTITDGASISDASAALLAQPLDLSEPVQVTLSLYQDYSWTIRAIQEIERYFTVANQVGESDIDVESRTVTVTVPDVVPLTEIEVLSMKLAGPGAVYSPSLAGVKYDFSSPVEVSVTDHGHTEVWTVSVLQTATTVFLDPVDAWTSVAWLYGRAEAGKANGFEYRVKGTDSWTEVPQEWITRADGMFKACLMHLSPQTTYEARSCSGDEYSAVQEFTTGSIVQLPNSQFEEWCFINNKMWAPWGNAADDKGYWGTGNKGATLLSKINVTMPIDDIMSITGYRGVHLESRNVVGKYASGNVFAGEFKGIDGTDGILSFGQPFTERPTALSTRIKFHSEPISKASSFDPNLTYMLNQPDTCIIWCALIDGPSPYEIRTKKSNRHLFDRNAECVIAYGEVYYGDDIPDYVDVDIPLVYKDNNRKPTYILVVASTSKYGDFYTGGPGSTLDILHFTLKYDY